MTTPCCEYAPIYWYDCAGCVPSLFVNKWVCNRPASLIDLCHFLRVPTQIHNTWLAKNDIVRVAGKGLRHEGCTQEKNHDRKIGLRRPITRTGNLVCNDDFQSSVMFIKTQSIYKSFCCSQQT